LERSREVLRELAALLDREGEQVCAVVVEPMVQAAAGMLTHDPSFVRGVRELCDEHGVLMIADEVATGIGRTGRMWALEHAGVTPDLLTCGKGLTVATSRCPLCSRPRTSTKAFLGSPTSGRTFFHGHTYTANPLCCAAAIANLGLMAQRDTVAQAARVGTRLGDLLKPLEDDDRVLEVRRIGTMTGIEVRASGERTVSRCARRLAGGACGCGRSATSWC
jgi:adenosylmethionine-8-amino-7-oxononanoate aminotransferase